MSNSPNLAKAKTMFFSIIKSIGTINHKIPV